MEIVNLKQDMYSKRFKAEFGASKEPTTAAETSHEQIAHQIEQIRDEVFNVNFDESGRELIQKFRLNFQRLREFMQAIDKEIAALAVFNKREDPLSADYGAGNDENDGGLSGNTSVHQLKHMLKNYDALVEG